MAAALPWIAEENPTPPITPEDTATAAAINGVAAKTEN